MAYSREENRDYGEARDDTLRIQKKRKQEQRDFELEKEGTFQEKTDAQKLIQGTQAERGALATNIEGMRETGAMARAQLGEEGQMKRWTTQSANQALSEHAANWRWMNPSANIEAGEEGAMARAKLSDEGAMARQKSSEAAALGLAKFGVENRSPHFGYEETPTGLKQTVAYDPNTGERLKTAAEKDAAKTAGMSQVLNSINHKDPAQVASLVAMHQSATPEEQALINRSMSKELLSATRKHMSSAAAPPVSTSSVVAPVATTVPEMDPAALRAGALANPQAVVAPAAPAYQPEAGPGVAPVVAAPAPAYLPEAGPGTAPVQSRLQSAAERRRKLLQGPAGTERSDMYNASIMNRN